MFPSEPAKHCEPYPQNSNEHRLGDLETERLLAIWRREFDLCEDCEQEPKGEDERNDPSAKYFSVLDDLRLIAYASGKADI